MSSMRNAIQRRSHRERAQPHARRHLGLLEKHKDYTLRARDFSKKKAQLRTLRRKATDRNEDEFYFGMLSRAGPGSALTAGGDGSGRKSWRGVVGAPGGNRGDGVRALDVDAVRLLKTQDVGYVRTARNAATGQLRRAEERAVMAGLVEPRPGPAKIVFYDDDAEREEAIGHADAASAGAVGQSDEDDDDDDDDIPDDADSDDGWNGLDDNDGDEVPVDGVEAARRKEREKIQKELDHARRKARVLAQVEQELDEQRAKMAKTATSGGFTKKGKRIMVRTRKR